MSFAETPSQDEDRWRLRERMLEIVEPLQSASTLDASHSVNEGAHSKRMPPLFQPRQPAPITRSKLHILRRWISSRFAMEPKGVNDNMSGEGPNGFWNSARLIAQREMNGALARCSHHLKRIAPHLARTLRLRTADIIAFPIALVFFILPLLALSQFDATPSTRELALTLIGTSLLTSIIFGARFGTIAVLSAFTWLSLSVFEIPTQSQLTVRLGHWMTLIISAAGLAMLSIALGFAAHMIRDLMRLALKVRARENDIIEFQAKLRRARHADAILSFLVAYCRDRFDRRAIFLALDDGSSSSDDHAPHDIAAQLKATGYARVMVDRRAYLPRAIASFKASGFDTFTLETPSGPIALMGLEQSAGHRLSASDTHYLKLILTTAAYAIERITFKAKLEMLEDEKIESQARNAAILTIVGNLASTTQNLDDQAFGLHQLLDREMNKPYDTAMNFIRRNISALRNSIALLRDVTS